jgi:6-phosphogluconolactonase
VELIVVDDPAALAARAAQWIADRLRAAVTARGAFHVALAGGGTPRATHEQLAHEQYAGLPWERVHVYFGDERAVPPDHPDSNYRMARESLLSRVPIPAAQVHRMEAERADRDRAARDYEAVLPDRLDVIMLGMGEDGHTASLFPGAPSLGEKARRVLAIAQSPKPPPERLTLTPRALAEARDTVVLSAGAGKADMLARVLQGPYDPKALPVQLAREGTWIIDRAAAARLPAGDNL